MIVVHRIGDARYQRQHRQARPVRRGAPGEALNLRTRRNAASRQGEAVGGLARHLWRMCFALFIAAGSFFSIRARVASILPEPFTTPLMRALPVVLVFVAMSYWLWRVRGRRPIAVARMAPAATVATDPP